MSETKPDKEFWDLADSFIHLANKHCDKILKGKVSATLLYAAARFNAFVVVASTKTKKQFAAGKEESVAYFLGQFEKMLRENFDDHEANYEKYKR